jgi:N-acetylmuramoyl-L-alanine amidase
VLDFTAPTPINIVREDKLIRIEVLEPTAPVTPAAPSAPEKGVYKVVLDAGHGGKDPGAPAINGRHEKEYTLAITLKVKALLDKEPKIKPYLTRSDDTFVELNERAKIANDLKADLFISFHANRTDSPSVTGAETYYSRSDSLAFAKVIHKHLVAGTGLADRKIRQANFAVIKKTTMPAVLLEAGYLSNKNDTAALFDDARQNRIAAEIVAGIKEYLKIT